MLEQPTDLSERAVRIAAKATGLREDQIAAALREYRKALGDVETEPEWRAVMHLEEMHLYADPAGVTRVTLALYPVKGKSDVRIYSLGNQGFKSYAEARTYELEQTTRPAPRAI